MRASSKSRDTTDQALFWAFVAGIAWAPFWFGSNDLIAWGINAMLFPAMAIMYEASLLIRRAGHKVGIGALMVPALLFAAVVLWIVIQNATWTPGYLHHPIWGMAAETLERPVEGSISVNRDLTTLALLRLITAASVFWVAVQLCRNGRRANLLVKSIAAIVGAYALYGLVSFALDPGRVLWVESSMSRGLVTSTFINRNSFATYAGIGFVVIWGLILRVYLHEVATRGGSARFKIASFIETTGKKATTLLGGAFVILVALLLSGSRGGIIATALGLVVLGLLSFGRSGENAKGHLVAICFGAILVAAVVVFFGDVVAGRIASTGLYDENRMAGYVITLRSIFNEPWLGYGYGTFVDIFPMFRDQSMSVQGKWEMAHNTYLEIFQGLGIPFGALLLACVILLVLRCFKGATTRQANASVPAIAASVAALVGVHALVDFSLQIQAIALTFIAILGAGVAQSESSRLALGD